MADTIISTDGLTNLASAIQDTKYETTIRDYQNKDYLSDKLTQLNIADQTRTNGTDDKITASDWQNEARATRGVDELLAESRFLDLGAARRADAASLQAQNNASANVIAQNLASFQAAQQADRVAQAQVVAADSQTARILAASEASRDEARDAANAAVIAGYVTREAIRTEGDATRALINHNYNNTLRDELMTARNALIEVRGDVRHWEHEGRRHDRDFLNSNIAAVSNQVNALHSQFQSATQGTVNFGSMSGNAGRNTSTNNVV